MATQGPNYPGTATSVSATGGTVAWSNPSNAGADDSSYATVVPGPGNQYTHELRVTNLGFSVPAGAVIDGVLVEVKAKASPAGTNDVQLYTISLCKNGSALGGAGGHYLTTSDAVYTSGSSTSTPGSVTLTPTDVNDSTFGVEIPAYAWSGTQTVSVDYVRVTVYYHVPPVITVSTASLSDFGNVDVGATSSEQTFTVSGTDLTANLVVTAPTHFEVSTSSGSGFGSSVSLAPSGGTVGTTTIYARFTPTSGGAKSGNIAATSTGATTKNVAVTGTGVAFLPFGGNNMQAILAQ